MKHEITRGLHGVTDVHITLFDVSPAAVAYVTGPAKRDQVGT